MQRQGDRLPVAGGGGQEGGQTIRRRRGVGTSPLTPSPERYFLWVVRVFPPANDNPRASKAWRSRSSALGPTPCSSRSSASLTRVNCSSRTYPAPASARSAGVPNPVGRPESCCSLCLFFMVLPRREVRIPPARRVDVRRLERGEVEGDVPARVCHPAYLLSHRYHRLATSAHGDQMNLREPRMRGRGAGQDGAEHEDPARRVSIPERFQDEGR